MKAAAWPPHSKAALAPQENSSRPYFAGATTTSL